jgi:hypothetical protein
VDVRDQTDAGRIYSGVPADVLLGLSRALCPRGAVAAPMRPAEIVEGCADPGQRSELWQFLDCVDALPPAERTGLVEAFDEIQVRSKLWLIDELARVRDLGEVELLVLGAWYGVLPLLCNLRLERPPARMVCVDLDPHPCQVGAEVIGSLYPNIRYRCADVMTYDYRAPGDRTTVVVNTICEHLPAIAQWWHRLPPGQLVVLQSNNYFPCPDHVNCVRSVDEMKAQTPLAEILFEGALPLPLFDRFMLIGHR